MIVVRLEWLGNRGDVRVVRRRYGLLIGALVVATLGVAAGAGLYFVYAPLPDPTVATHRQLLGWLVLRDLSKEPVEIRQKILVRLDSEFEKTQDLEANIGHLEGYQRQILWQNFSVLLGPWLFDKAQQYSQLSSSHQTEYIDHFLDRAELWNKVGTACLKKEPGQTSESEWSAGTSVLKQIQRCCRDAEPGQRRQIEVFMTAVQARWLWRQLPALKLFGKPAVNSK
jgi:hypothetical protein